MLWSRVVLEVSRFTRLDRVPDILILPAGGNDLGIRSSREPISNIRFNFIRLRIFFHGTILLWSDIVARTSWRAARSVNRLNRVQVKVNKEVERFVGQNGIRHLTVPER